MRKSKKLLVFLSAIVVLVSVMCFGASAASATCPENFNGQHQWGEYDRKRPTCEEDGYNKYRCYYCKEEKSEIVPAYGGTCNLVFNSTQACCAWYKCANGQCTVTKIVVVNPDFHEWDGCQNDYVAPTCTTDGSYYELCMICQQAKKTVTIPATGHRWEPFDVNYSCMEEFVYYCEGCDEKKKEINPSPSDHAWSRVDYNGDVASCSPDYWECLYCEDCGQSKTVTGATTGHYYDWDSEVTDWKDPTCTTPGYERAYCGCGLYEERTIPATGEHIWEMSVDTPETCTEDGWQEFECLYGCGATEHIIISATGHTYKNDWSEILAPSCTGQGVKIKVCNECSFVNFETLASLGHTDDDKDGKCDVCKSLLECSGTVTPEAPHEHIFGDWVTEGTLSLRQCECGHMEMKIVTDGGDVEIEYPDSDEGSFEVETVEGDSFVLVEEKAAAELGEGWEVLKAFDFNLKNSDGVHVQPDGSVKVKLPLDWEKEGNYKVYRVNDDGSFTDMNAYQQGSHMVFETDHFSVYVIVEEVTVDAPSDTAPEQPKKETNVFDFLINFFNSILDFFKNLFKIK